MALLMAGALTGLGAAFWRQARLNDPLIRSVRGLDARSVRVLLDMGANPDATGPAKRYWAAPATWFRPVDSALLIAASRPNDARAVEIVRLLLAHGARIDVRGAYGDTPLIRATVWRNEAVMRMLIARGADVNARQNSGHTALHLVRDYPHRFRGMLLRAGARE